MSLTKFLAIEEPRRDSIDEKLFSKIHITHDAFNVDTSLISV